MGRDRHKDQTVLVELDTRRKGYRVAEGKPKRNFGGRESEEITGWDIDLFTQIFIAWRRAKCFAENME